MGHYTTLHFRAKLQFNLPENVRQVLRAQFVSYDVAHAAFLANGKEGESFHFSEWTGADALGHPFFDLPRADLIPWGRQGDDFPVPTYREYPDGSSILDFTCEFKNYNDEIKQFLDWIRPYVRDRYGKRLRGRHRVWVGYMKPEEMGRCNLFIKPTPLPGFFEGNLYGREVEIDWQIQ